MGSPECRRSIADGLLEAALPQIDIYQLGFILWMIIANKYSIRNSVFCEIANCTTSGEELCTELHANLIQLPSPHEQIPQYLREVIAICLDVLELRLILARIIGGETAPSTGCRGFCSIEPLQHRTNTVPTPHRTRIPILMAPSPSTYFTPLYNRSST